MFKFIEIRVVSFSVMQYPNGIICEQVASECEVKWKQGCQCQSDLTYYSGVSVSEGIRDVFEKQLAEAPSTKKKKKQCWKAEAAICETDIKCSPLR